LEEVLAEELAKNVKVNRTLKRIAARAPFAISMSRPDARA
jgi:hypothetical protein